jgi:predicted nuclease of restriction endonuclease-like (RecB) superfamily
MPEPLPTSTTVTPLSDGFAEISQWIVAARLRAVQAVNTTLIDLYCQICRTISQKLAQAQWGDGVVAQLAAHLARTQPGLRGFTRSNLFRMCKFYETYQGDEVVAPLARQLSWSHNITILDRGKRPEEREFYLRLAIREQWGKRELAWQFKTALFERTVLTPTKLSAVLSQMQPDALGIFKDSYVVEFLGLPQGHAEADLLNGMMTANDLNAYVSSCIDVLNNPTTLELLVNGCRTSANEYTVENMTCRFADGVVQSFN